MHRVVGIGEWQISDVQTETIVTYALASCVGVTVYCPIRKVSGMIHILLPAPRSDEEARKQPARFATTGVPMLIHHMIERYGCNERTLEVRVYGGAAHAQRHNRFRIGSRNLEKVYEELRKMNIVPRKSEIGGRISRTLEMSVRTGDVRMKTLPLSS